MTARHSHGAILLMLVVILAGCGHKTAKTAKTEPAPTTSAPQPEQPAARKERPPAPPAIAANPPSTPSAPASPQSVDEFAEEPALQDVFFEAGGADIGPSRARFMKENARWILENPGYLVLIEGHTDAKGTHESRLAIADRRAKAAARFFLEEGVSNTRLFTISHGSDRPTCLETTESCAARNRRVHFRVKKE
jgi:peptidoglycan-associated lipoprotein